MICRHRINLFINNLNYVNKKHLHLSHFSYVRKPSSSRRTLNPSFEDVQEHTVSGVFPDAPKNIFKNFYGVEGDEGVINVEELGGSEKSVRALEKKTPLQPTNEYRNFNFGAVRLDNENKPSYYGRIKFNQNIVKGLDSVGKNTEQNKDNITFENLENELNQSISITKDVSKPSLSPEEKNSGYHNLENGTTVSTQLNSLKSENRNVYTYKQNHFSDLDSSKVSESFIDKYYFTENCPENVASCMGKSTESFIKEQKSKERNINASEILAEANIHDFKKSNLDSFKSDIFQSEDTHISDTHNQNQLNSSNVSESFIDKHYFAENYKDNFIPQTEKHADNFIEEQYFKESNINASKSDYKTTTDDFVPINENSKPSVVHEKSDFKFHQNIEENKACSYDNDIKLNHTMNIQDLTKEFDVISSSKSNTVEYEKNKPKEDLPKKFAEKKSSSLKTGLNKERDYDSRVFSQTENSKNEADSESTLNSFEKSQENEPIVEKKIETAFDFVKKLKGNNLLPDDVKKGISAKKEKKVDSKGFRILKHQVPTLNYFTKDEMLELLKGNILYSDEDIVVLNKPYNLVIHESNTSQELACLSRYLDDLAKLLDQNTNSPKLLTVHRLDKETTGCLLLARNEVSAARLKSFFAQRKIVKTYWIVTSKVPDPMEGIIDIPISEGKIGNKSRMVLHPKLPDEVRYVSHSKAGKQAITQYSVIAVSGNAALVEVKPETGIKHQIRVHFGFGLGCPILGDHKYSHLDKLVPQKLASDLLQKLQVRQSKVRHIPLHIHAKHIFIPQYSNERNLFVTAPLPRHMSENLRFLKFKKK